MENSENISLELSNSWSLVNVECRIQMQNRVRVRAGKSWTELG